MGFGIANTKNDNLKVGRAEYLRSETLPYFVDKGTVKCSNQIISYILQGMKIVDVDIYYDVDIDGSEAELNGMLQILLERDGLYYSAFFDGKERTAQINEISWFEVDDEAEI